MPQQNSFSSYSDTLRNLKQRASTSETSFRSVGHQIYNHFDQVPELESQWARRVATYAAIVDDSQTAATRLSAVIDMYTLLQPAFAKAQPGDVIHELGTFRKTLSATDDSYASRLDTLGGEIDLFLHHTEIVRLVPALTTGNALPPTGGQNVFNENTNSRQGVIANIQYLLHEIQEQKPLFGVIRQIANELISEFDRYSAGLEPFNGKPSTTENADAARLVHADIAARGTEWRELAQVLSREYARR
ncbi:uncharacterized protein TRAVEDRAFT_50918 [Trametes versicolor FP-101664 SS1]|uniref:uncharacterized protein n=1 Tax=Trametes versicolor (strain FP-101664) TaxID=717944 RepID=UPI0004622B9B|nr:uncharacterized protein TRAVEDRAFT_50918 [Trametes versicolor FP-101664 SS1]EIW54779.1 hypothetical protein TRAVEDRAFT_50918 [Trametes versicolor FP-101664 SS1]